MAASKWAISLKNPGPLSWGKSVALTYLGLLLLTGLLAGSLAGLVSGSKPSTSYSIRISSAQFKFLPTFQAEALADHSFDQQVNLPHRIDSPSGSTEGYMWYSMKFESINDRNLEAIYIPRLAINGRVYLNGVLISTLGQLDGPRAERHWNTPQFIFIPQTLLKTGSNSIKLQIFGYANYLAGVSEIWVGDAQELREAYKNRRELQIDRVYLSVNFITGMGIVLVMLLLVNRIWDVNLWLITAACFLWAGRNLALLMVTPPMDHAPWVKFTQGGLMLFVSTLMGFVSIIVTSNNVHGHVALSAFSHCPISSCLRFYPHGHCHGCSM